MSGIGNAPMQPPAHWETHFSYNDMLDRFEPLATLSPAQRRQLESHPELNPNNEQYWKSRFSADDFKTDPDHFDLNPSVSAFHELLSTIAGRIIETDLGVSANDVRAGKYGALTRGALRELEKLDKNQDYRLITITREDNDSMIGSHAWAPVSGGTPVVIETWSDNFHFPPDGAEVLHSIDLSMLEERYIDEGLSANELRSGKYGRLSPEIMLSLEALQKDKDYALTTFPSQPPGGDPYMAWVEKGTGHSVAIGPDREHLMYG
ncbi:hypothetical protein CI807_28395 [Pseudomonas sp. NS1(2017)]|uniref:hypothetical protein n=1 Tax=Pseudomonas sp. NS1(2017) TaxID=2025658 RepID=UPI000BA201E0|nr:hypothetical protein [Pseudomonas sp. NS1(2017)]ASV39962.1 hypothetical protein CI807_28395 [Pseudomonas sp. NS1(2017)]